MIKTCMDADTILYISEDMKYGTTYARAYNKSYLRRNYPREYKRIAKATKIFYKVTKESDSWIDYNKAIKNNRGTYDKRIQEALKNPLMKLSQDLSEIPTVIYTDIEGFEHLIPPNDGLCNKPYWLEREDYYLFEPHIKPIYHTHNKGQLRTMDLEVTFDVPVNNCLITLNTLFYEYEHINPRKIIYKNIQEEMLKIRPLDSSDPNKTFYDANIKVYKWRGLVKNPAIRPVKKSKTTIIFDQTVDQNGLIFYKGLLYEHRLVTNNEIQLLNVTTEQLEQFELDKIQFIKFVTLDNRDIVFKFVNTGIVNNYYHEVQFIKPVTHSLTTFDGVDFDFESIDDFNLKYSDSLFGPSDVANNSIVRSVNFYLGRPNMGASAPIDIPEADTELEEKYNKYVKDMLKCIMNDYQDVIIPIKDSINVFKLNYKPVRDTVSFFINGVKYKKDTCYKYDRDTNTITWLFTEDVGGFDLKDSYTFVAVYDFDFEENNIKRPDDFIRKYLPTIKHS